MFSRKLLITFNSFFLSLFLFPQRFGRYVLRPSSGVCRTREPSRNFELRPLLNPWGSPVLIPLAITGYKYSYPVMANGIRTGDSRGFNKGRSSKFREGSRVRQTSEEGRRTYGPKRCENNTKDEDNNPKTLNDNNQQASSQKFRHL